MAGRLRHTPDVLRALLLAAGVALLARGDADGWFLVAGFALALLARPVALAAPLELAFVAATALNAAGNALHLFSRVRYFDEAAHFLTLLAVTPAVYAALAHQLALPSLSRPAQRAAARGIAAAVAMLAMAMGVVWELFEWGLDAAFATNLSLGYTDTLVDLATGAAGGALAGVASGLWARSGAR